MKLGSRQRAVLDLLAHQRIAPPDDGMTFQRIAQLQGWKPSRTRYVILSLEALDLVRFSSNGSLWRITDAGREALQ